MRLTAKLIFHLSISIPKSIEEDNLRYNNNKRTSLEESAGILRGVC